MDASRGALLPLTPFAVAMVGTALLLPTVSHCFAHHFTIGLLESCSYKAAPTRCMPFECVGGGGEPPPSPAKGYHEDN